MKAAWHALILGALAIAPTNVAPATDGPELLEHIRHNFLPRTNGSSQVFSKHVNGTSFTRNSNFWLRGLNGLTAIHAGDGPGATAITRWHVLGANHWKHDTGSKLYFCDLHDRTVVRTVVAGTEIRPDIKSDIWLAVLDEALPDSIQPVAVMPGKWTERLHAPGLPVAAMNQASAMGSAELLSAEQPVNGWFRHGYLYRAAAIAPRLGFQPMRAGDSGYPVLTIVETNLVLLGHLTLEIGSKFLGPDYSSYAEDIQSAITGLGTNRLATAERIRTADLSRFR